MSTATPTITLLAGTMGARVDGLDLTTATPQLGDALTDLLTQHRLLFFGPQPLDNEAQQALMNLLGEPYIHPLSVVAGRTEASPSSIVDDADHPPFQDSWHTDVTFDPEPPAIGSLRCIEMPERGGNTIWADTQAAYDSLSGTFQSMLEGLEAEHDMGTGLSFSSKGGQEIFEMARDRYSNTPHPVISAHPVSGRKAINVNRTFTRRIRGLNASESDAILNTLFAACENPNWQYRHRWAEGELCIWDERATQHFAVADHFPQRREMVRYVVR